MDLKQIELIFYYQKNRINAFNVLVAALETVPEFNHLVIRYPKTEERFIQYLDDAVRHDKRIITGWSFFSPEFPAIQNLLHRVKEAYSANLLLNIVGGVHATAEPEQCLRAGFDVAVISEGEETFIQLLQSQFTEQSFHTIKGIAFLENGKIVTTGYPDMVDLDQYPAYAIRHNRLNPLEITRGCIYACRYCQTPFMFKAKFRHRSVPQLESAIRNIKTERPIDLRFVTPSAFSYGSQDETVHLDKIEELLSRCYTALGSRGQLYFGTFPSEIRPEHITTEGLHLIKKYAANRNLIIGAQSGSQSVLDYSRRGHTVEQIIQAVRLSQEAGFEVNVDFIWGLPGETEETLHASMNLMETLIQLGARIHNHAFLPLPGTPFKNAPLGHLSPVLIEQFRKLHDSGQIYGDWEEQLSLSGTLKRLR